MYILGGCTSNKTLINDWSIRKTFQRQCNDNYSNSVHIFIKNQPSPLLTQVLYTYNMFSVSYPLLYLGAAFPNIFFSKTLNLTVDQRLSRSLTRWFHFKLFLSVYFYVNGFFIYNDLCLFCGGRLFTWVILCFNVRFSFVLFSGG